MITSPQILSLIGLIFLPACQLGPAAKLPGFPKGSSYKMPTSSHVTALPDDWWTLFGDRDLNQLIHRALDGNHDLASARARRDTARALVGSSRARLFPQLDLASRSGISRTTGDNLFPGVRLENQNYRGTFDLSYDADLWGANRLRYKAAKARAAAAEKMLDAQRLGIAAEVARQYFLLRALDAQESLLCQAIASRQESLRLQTSRQEAGLTNALSAHRAATERDLSRHDLAQIQRQRGSAENALAVLCGTTPANLHITPREKSPLAPVIAPDLPARVLARRPDLRAAEQELKAASAAVGIAQAAFYPNISVTGSMGFESLTPANFLNWQSRVLALGANLSAPLIDAGARRSDYLAARSQYEESLAHYRQTMLQALREVEDALVDLQGLSASRKALKSACLSAEKNHKLSQDQFAKGLVSYLEVVEAEQTLLSIRLRQAEIEGQFRFSQTNFIQALGGGWSSKHEGPPPSNRNRLGARR